MLAQAHLVAFAATTDGAKALEFYHGILALTVLSDDQFAIAFDANGTELRVQKVEHFTPQPFTSLGWQVADVAAVVKQLAKHGVSTERYPWMEQDGNGVWSAPSGARIAWFKDPEGNLLSVAQYAS